MKITNGELKELALGLMQLKGVKHPLVANRVGHAFRQIRPAVEALEEGEASLIETYAEKDEKGEPVRSETGTKIANVSAFVRDRKALLSEEVTVPDLKGVSYKLLAAAKADVTGELVVMLGSFLEGEPSEEIESETQPKPKLEKEHAAV